MPSGLQVVVDGAVEDGRCITPARAQGHHLGTEPLGHPLDERGQPTPTIGDPKWPIAGGRNRHRTGRGHPESYSGRAMRPGRIPPFTDGAPCTAQSLRGISWNLRVPSRGSTVTLGSTKGATRRLHPLH